MASVNDKLYRDADGHAWVGEYWVGRYPANAAHVADLPAAEDTRWQPGVPHTLDVQHLTLSPFAPSGRLGVCVETRSSKPLGQYPNHPPFAGCRAWMSVEAVDWQPVPIWMRAAPLAMHNYVPAWLEAILSESDKAIVGHLDAQLLAEDPDGNRLPNHQQSIESPAGSIWIDSQKRAILGYGPAVKRPTAERRHR